MFIISIIIIIIAAQVFGTNFGHYEIIFYVFMKFNKLFILNPTVQVTPPAHTYCENDFIVSALSLSSL